MATTFYVVEDNLSFLMELKILLEELSFEIIGVADNGAKAVEEISNLKPDLILMDIYLKGQINGFDIAKKIQYLNIPIIFITSHTDKSYYEKSSSYHPSAFLAKPIEPFTFQSVIKLLLNNITSTENPADQSVPLSKVEYLDIKKKNNYHRVYIQEITIVEADGNYCKIHTLDKGLFIHRSTMSAFEELLNDQFLRVHRSYFVNRNNITSYSLSQQTITIAGNRIPMSNKFKSKFKTMLSGIQNDE